MRSGLCGDNLLISLGFLRGVFLVNHLASTDNLTTTTKRQNTYKRKLTETPKVALLNSKHIQNKPRVRERSDRAWFSRLLRHPARKRSGSFLSTPESAGGVYLNVTLWVIAAKIS